METNKTKNSMLWFEFYVKYIFIPFFFFFLYVYNPSIFDIWTSTYVLVLCVHVYRYMCV